MAQQMKVFVSHSHKDNAFCKKLVKALKGAGADVWYDDESLHTGQLGPIIERELRDRPVFIVVLSPAALASRWVEDETRWAYNLLRHHDPTRIMLPVLAEALPSANDIWLFLQEFKRIGATGSKPFPLAQAIAQTLRALALTPAGAAPTPTTPQPAESVDDLIAHGKALAAQKKYAEALPFFERATQRDGRSFDAWANLGYVNGELGHWDETLAACDRALALDANDAVTWTNKGAALGNLGRYDEELAAYDRALALDPNDAATWSNKAYALCQLRRFGDAVAAVDRSLALDPNSAEAWSTKGEILNAQARFAEALPFLERALSLRHDHPEIWHDKAVALRGLRRVREAAEAERRANELGWQG
jgi:tetratricopeptide (TPR) repeat protein